jgi:hypothetical protein
MLVSLPALVVELLQPGALAGVTHRHSGEDHHEQQAHGDHPQCGMTSPKCRRGRWLRASDSSWLISNPGWR